MQSALLGIVTPELRAVILDVCGEDGVVYIRFYYEGEVSEKLIDLWECALSEATADLDPNCLQDIALVRLDYPKEIPFRGRLAYLRKEPN